LGHGEKYHQAFALYLYKVPLKKISTGLKVPEAVIDSWMREDNWDAQRMELDNEISQKIKSEIAQTEFKETRKVIDIIEPVTAKLYDQAMHILENQTEELDAKTVIKSLMDYAKLQAQLKGELVDKVEHGFHQGDLLREWGTQTNRLPPPETDEDYKIQLIN
jgi:hypothetical protein